MNIYKFYNNKSTLLTASLSNTVTTLPVSSLTSDIINYQIQTGEKILATLSNVAETLVEIVEVVATIGSPTITGYTIVRGSEGTSDQTWAAGSKFSLRLTSKHLDSFPQNTTIGNGTDGLETDIKNAVIANTRWAATTAVTESEIRIWPTSGTPTHAYYYLKDGTTAASGTPAATGDTIVEGSTIRIEIDIDLLGNITHGGQYSLIHTDNSSSNLNVGTTIGSHNLTYSGGLGATNIGAFNTNMGSNIIVGSDNKCFSLNKSIILGTGCSSVVDNTFVTSTIPSRPNEVIPFEYFSGSGNAHGGVEGIIWSPVLDFTGGATWTASSQVRHGHVRKPTVANGNQYVRLDNLFTSHLLSKHPSLYTTFGTTGASQPTWPTTAFQTVTDGSGDWVCIPNVGLTLNFPSRFIPKEVGIVIHDYTSITVQPSLSFGKSGNNTAFKANAQTTDLTANNKVQIYTLTGLEATNTFTISINTLATGTMLLGQVFVRGVMCPRWY